VEKKVICTGYRSYVQNYHNKFAQLTGTLAGAARGRVVACLVTARDLHVLVAKVAAAAISAENVVVVGVVTRHGARHVDKGDVGDQDAVGGLAGGAAVQVVLLDVEAIVGDAAHGDVLVGDVVDLARRVGVALDAAAVARVDEHAVAKGYTVDEVVGLAADGADGEAVPAVAVHVVDEHVGAARDGHAVILVDDLGVLDGDAVTAADAEAVAVVRGGISVGQVVGRKAGAVVQKQPVNGHPAAACDLDVMHGPVDDVQVLDNRVIDARELQEPVGLGTTAIGALAVPVGSSVALEHVSSSSRNGQARAGDLDGDKVMIGSRAKGLSAALAMGPHGKQGGTWCKFTVLPAKVTLVPFCRLVRSMLELAGVYRSWRTMSVQLATAAARST
jgi:hypothetical protein